MKMTVSFQLFFTLKSEKAHHIFTLLKFFFANDQQRHLLVDLSITNSFFHIEITNLNSHLRSNARVFFFSSYSK